MKVCKFGGTSVASASQIQKVASILLKDPSRKIVVVSAPGKRYEDDIKVTDLLIQLGVCALKGENIENALAQVLARYNEIARELNIEDLIMPVIEEDIRKRISQSNQQNFLDIIKASGEDNNAKLIAAYLCNRGIPARYLNPLEAGLIVNDFPKRTLALPMAYTNLKQTLSDNNYITVFPGFFGFTQDGLLRTFDRGGSDITGSILAAAVRADLYENFTDVNSVFCANPRVIHNPEEIQEITYREMRELSYAGFSVFHDEALMPVYKLGIPVSIKNTNNPDAPGTKIVSVRKENRRPITGISADNGFSILYVSKYLMNREIGFGRKLLQILEEEFISYEHTPSGLDDISVIFRSHQLTPEKEERILFRVKEELHAEDVHFRHDFSMIVLVGEGMNNSTGLAARAAAAIARTGANIEMINQGSSEVSLAFGVHQSNEEKILQALYNEFFTPISV